MSSLKEDLLPYFSELPSYTDDLFYKFVKKFVVTVEGEIIEIQRIKNIRILLKITDIFGLFQINNKEILKLNEKACLIDDSSSYVVRAGIRSNLEEFIELLNNYYEPTTPSDPAKRLSSCICSSFNKNNDQSRSFVLVFIDSLMKNSNRSSNNYKFDDNIKKFASVFNILAGHQAYEFIRFNLPGALPSVTTFKNYNNDMNLYLNEG